MKRRRRQMGDKVITKLWLSSNCRLTRRHRLGTVASRSTKESEAWVVLARCFQDLRILGVKQCSSGRTYCNSRPRSRPGLLLASLKGESLAHRSIKNSSEEKRVEKDWCVGRTHMARASADKKDSDRHILSVGLASLLHSLYIHHLPRREHIQSTDLIQGVYTGDNGPLIKPIHESYKDLLKCERVA